MNYKINLHYVNIAIFALFFFFWGITLSDFKGLFPLSTDHQYYNIINKFKLSYFIIFLIIPIFYNFVKKKDFSFNQIFNHQKYIYFFVSFVIVHFFLVNIYYNEIINKYEIANLIYFLLVSLIYCHYREFILVNFKKIITFYLIIFILTSIFEGFQIYNQGQCRADFFLIDLIKSYLNISFTNGIYLENSHLAMGTVAVFFSCLYILVQEKKINILFLLLFLIEVIIIFNNLSTTYFVGYFFSIVTLLIFFIKKINIKFWIVAVMLLSMNSYFFLSDKNCIIKVTQLNTKDILNKDLKKNKKNLTTLVYERSIMVTKDTLMYRQLGWGFDGMDNANFNIVSKYDDGAIILNVEKDSPAMVAGLLENDVIKYINKNKVRNNLELSELILASKGEYIEFTVSRQMDLVDGSLVYVENSFLDSLSDNRDHPDLIFRVKPNRNSYIDEIHIDEKIKKLVGIKYGIYNNTYWKLKVLNMKDGLSNFLKMLTEFGIFTFVILFYFIKYILNLKNISPYNLFIIVLFVTICIRGAGYFSGGFIFCLLEFFYYKNFVNEFKK